MKNIIINKEYVVNFTIFFEGDLNNFEYSGIKKIQKIIKKALSLEAVTGSKDKILNKNIPKLEIEIKILFIGLNKTNLSYTKMFSAAIE